MGATSIHFSDQELRCPHCQVNGATQELVDMLEQFRTHVGGPVSITSGYRCPDHNQATGGAFRSQHVLGRAADVTVPTLTPSALESIARECPLVIGIGRNDHAGFLHIDCRATRLSAEWCYDAAGQQCTYYPPTTWVPA